MLTVAEFRRRFPNEKACRNYLFRYRWPNGYCCPRCGHRLYYYVKTRDVYECRECRIQTSVTAGTLLHGTKLPLHFWFLAMFLVSSGHPCSARWLAAALELNYRSALGMLRKIRHAMRRENGTHPLSRVGSDDFIATCSSGTAPKTMMREEEADSNVLTCAAKLVHEMPEEKHDIVERAKRLALEKANAFIRQTYRRVHRKYMQNYIDEFYYRSIGRFEHNRFSDMLNACVMVPPAIHSVLL